MTDVMTNARYWRKLRDTRAALLAVNDTDGTVLDATVRAKSLLRPTGRSIIGATLSTLLELNLATISLVCKAASIRGIWMTSQVIATGREVSVLAQLPRRSGKSVLAVAIEPSVTLGGSRPLGLPPGDLIAIGTADTDFVIESIEGDTTDFLATSVVDRKSISVLDLLPLAERDALAFWATTLGTATAPVTLPSGVEAILTLSERAPADGFTFSLTTKTAHASDRLGLRASHQVNPDTDLAVFRSPKGATLRVGSTDSRLAKLGPREREIVTELLNGFRPPAIARRLFLSAGTVRNHLSAVYRKLGVHSQQELITTLRAPQIAAVHPTAPPVAIDHASRQIAVVPAMRG